ncbi:MAG TPA: cysteine-rich CWC family protein [Ferruginibacter sp.]|nr:cysteine-rich CWC family protein [Ferruginibacter sp.]HRE62414.1 cysteine-rich CWC family protein [Ferruginibacter sp.]
MNNQHCKHEPKTCPRCNRSFECKPGDIGHCQCHGFQFTDSTKAFIAQKYADCLCRQCLQELSIGTVLFKEKFGHNPH